MDQPQNNTTPTHPATVERRTRLLGTAGVLAPHRYAQPEITTALGAIMGIRDATQHAMLTRLHTNSTVHHRNLAIPLPEYQQLEDFGAANSAFIQIGTDLGGQALQQALAAQGLEPADVDLIVCVTVTGLAVPSLDARIAACLGLRPDVKRLPLVGLGCVAGAAGIARVHDHLVGHPQDIAVLVSVELCSLTVQRDDLSPANLVASGLFGDGAAAVVLAGAESTLPAGADGSGVEVVATRSRMYPDTERAMGWDVGAGGLKIVLGVEVPSLVEQYLRDDVDSFLAAHGLDRSRIDWWVAHPGGPKVLEAMQSALELHDGELAVTWNSLAEIGNLSSASVLHVLTDTLRDHAPRPGTWGLMIAMGPGFCAELVLLQAGER